MRLMQNGAKKKQKRGLAVTKRKLAAVRVESRHHHHVERWGTERSPEAGGTKPEGRCIARRDEERCRRLLQTGMSI